MSMASAQLSAPLANWARVASLSQLGSTLRR
jgi:hypothetical protein